MVLGVGLGPHDRVRAELTGFLAGVVEHFDFRLAPGLDECEFEVRTLRLLEEHVHMGCGRVLLGGIQFEHAGRDAGAPGEREHHCCGKDRENLHGEFDSNRAGCFPDAEPMIRLTPEQSHP